MALPILDGNQSATTLSTIVTGGQHIPAHTVISLGSQAITDMRSAISGSVVSISNFPATQTIAGTVTANLPSNGETLAFVQEVDTPIVNHGINISFLDETSSSGKFVSQTSPLPISGTVTANVPALDIQTTNAPESVVEYDAGLDLRAIRSVPYFIDSATGDHLAVNNSSQPLPISGTVTVGASSVTFNSHVAKRSDGSWQHLSVESGSNYVNARVYPPSSEVFSATVTVGNSVTIGNTVTVAGTVTANNPSGALTTRFGSVTTANTAQLTSAVTNASRKYLLVQNIATSTVTIGIGFAPTTTQGIQLTAGAGLTFDAFCPTGGVWWLSSTTGSNWSILEG